MFSQSPAGHNLEELQALTMELGQYVHDAAREGVAAHVVEKGIWNRVLEMGRQAFGRFIAGQGDGDVGETFADREWWTETVETYLAPMYRFVRARVPAEAVDDLVHLRRGGSSRKAMVHSGCR